MWLLSKFILFLIIIFLISICVDCKKVRYINKKLKQPDPYHRKLVQEYYAVRQVSY